MGFFRMKVPVFADPFVTTQMLFVLLLVLITAVTLTITHKATIMMVDENVVAQSAAVFGYFGGLAGFLFGFYVFDNLATYSIIKMSYLGGFWGYGESQPLHLPSFYMFQLCSFVIVDFKVKARTRMLPFYYSGGFLFYFYTGQCSRLS
jgi:hypothetical protein